jgi:hypothetical protein
MGGGKMKMGWSFDKEHGFSKSCGGGVQVKGYMRGGPVRKAEGGTVKPTGKSFPAAPKQSPTVGAKGPDLDVKFPGNHLAFAKGGHFESENSEPHESQEGYSHKEPEQGEPLEARKGGKIMRKAEGGPVHNHFLSSHKLASMPVGLHQPALGHKVHPHHKVKTHEKVGYQKFAAGGMARPTGMPRAPVIGMKRQRHAPSMPGGGGQGMGRPQPGIPGMPQGGTASFGQQPMKPRGIPSAMGTMGGMAGGMKKGGHHKK